VLILEDDLAVEGLESKQLSSAGYQVIPVVDGKLALEMFHSRRPDVVITDLSMPGMDGFEFIRRLRQEQPNTPIIVVTGMGEQQGKAALAAGANVYLPKPVDRKVLLDRVEKQIAAARTRARGKKMHVLVFEDDPLAQRLMRGILEPAGFRVTAVENGAAALEIVEGDPPDLLMCDIFVPGIDGIQLVSRLRTELGYKAPILVVSAHTEEKYRKGAQDAGADGFLTKPVDRAVLLALVEKLLSKKSS